MSEQAGKPDIVGWKPSMESYSDGSVLSKSASAEDSEATNALLQDLIKSFEPAKEAEGEDEELAKAVESGEISPEELAILQAAANQQEADKQASDEGETESISAEDLALSHEMNREAAGYYDLGGLMATEKIAAELLEAGEIQPEEAQEVSDKVAALSESLIVKKASEAALGISSEPGDPESLADSILKNASEVDDATNRHLANIQFFGLMGKAAAHGFVDTLAQTL